MKRLMISVVLTLCVFALFAVNLLTENFDYPVGNLAGTGGWAVTDAGGTNSIQITTPSLTFPGYAASGIGNAATLGPSGEDLNKSFASTTSGYIYVSLLMKVTALRGTQDYNFLMLDTSTTNFRGRIFIKKTTNETFKFGFSKGTSTAVFTTNDYNINTVYNLVIKVQIVEGASNDIYSLFIFTDAPPSTEPQATLIATDSAADLVNHNAIGFRQGSSSNCASSIVDGIMVSTSWPIETLPVTFSTFDAISTTSNMVNIQWVTQTETAIHGYYIYRNTENNSATAQRISSLIPATNTSTTHNYEYQDSEVTPGQTYYYWIVSLEQNENSSWFGPRTVTVLNPEIPEVLPTATSLIRTYPNPFNQNNAQKIEIEVKEAETAELNIFNVKGQTVKTYSNIIQGKHELTWDGRDNNNNKCASGMYFYRLSSPTTTVMKKVMIVK